MTRRRAGTLIALAYGTLLILGAPALAGTVDPVAPQQRGLAATAPVLPLVVLRGFDPPTSRYAAGHRGVDLAASPETIVAAASAGVVTFAGTVAGRGVVVIAHPDGISTEYEPLTPSVAVGQHVGGGAMIGTLHGTHNGCATSCLHWGAFWGAHEAGQYLDPLLLLKRLGVLRLVAS